MDLTGGRPFWPVKNGLVRAYPRLNRSATCDVCIVGAGITGALIAHHLHRAKMKVGVIDSREVGWGSTSASTALLQYENDAEMQELAARYGKADALLAYRESEKAIGSLRKIAGTLRGVEFQPMQSLYFASRWYHQRRLEKEGALRKANGFSLKVLDREQIADGFGIDSPAALLTKTAAQVDPYRFAHQLLANIQRQGAQVHARTEMKGFEVRRGGVRVQTADGLDIHCKHLVLAAGYENQLWLEQTVASNRSSYAFVSEPMPNELGALRRTLVWESARPYLYMRTTADQRLLVGGEDDNINIPVRRDARVRQKAETLVKRVEKLLPHLKVKVAFAWAGTFAETDDGLPFFGTHRQHGSRVHFAMAYGGNGITYSLIGAELLRDSLQGKRHPCAALFSFDRLER